MFYHSGGSDSDNTVVSPADSPVSAVPHHSSAVHAALHHISQSLHHQQTHHITAASTDVDRVSEYYLSSCDATTTVSTTEQQHYNSSTTATAVTPDYRTNYVSILSVFSNLPDLYIILSYQVFVFRGQMEQKCVENLSFFT